MDDRSSERHSQTREGNAESDKGASESSCSTNMRPFPLPFIKRDGADHGVGTSLSQGLFMSAVKIRSCSDTGSCASSGGERTTAHLSLLHTGDLGSEGSLTEELRPVTMDPTVSLRLSTPSRRTREAHTGADPRSTRRHLLSAFPESLKHIAVDEAAVSALDAGDTALTANSGYHHQFTEQTLLEIHSLLLRTAAACEARKQYLVSTVHAEGTGLSRQATDCFAEVECARDLSVWSESWYKQYPPTRGEVLTAVTVRPPLFKAGMLWNGEDKFLFGGTAFVEEARVVQVKVPQTPRLPPIASHSTTLCTEASGTTKDTWTDSGGGSEGELQEHKKVAHLLVREYSSVSKVRAGTLVQTFSLVSDHVHGNMQRNQAVKLLSECVPGAVTRGFSLQMLLPPSLRATLDSAGYENPFLNREGEYYVPEEGNIDCGMSYANDSAFANTVNSEFMSSTATLMMNRTLKARSRRRQPLGDETYLRFSNPKLYAFVMQHSPAILTSHTNAIREYMLYNIRLRIRRKIASVMHAVRILQKFFRSCLTRKRHAVKRMLRQWRRLEHQCRLRLRKQTFDAPNLSRINYIVGSVLWEHVLTTDEYKLSMLEEQMRARRAGYLRWCAQRREEQRMILEVNPESVSVGVDGPRKVDDSDGTPPLQESGVGVASVSRVRQKVDASVSKSHHRWIAKWRDVVHARFGWYIEPELLLRESHRRLLHSLRDSILTMSDVQAALRKRGNDRELTLI